MPISHNRSATLDSAVNLLELQRAVVHGNAFLLFLMESIAGLIAVSMFLEGPWSDLNLVEKEQQSVQYVYVVATLVDLHLNLYNTWKHFRTFSLSYRIIDILTKRIQVTLFLERS